MIYLDNAATTLIKPLTVSGAMLSALRSCASPGRGAHRAAMLAAETVFRCRESAAALFHVSGAGARRFYDERHARPEHCDLLSGSPRLKGPDLGL